jgi:hypothetical protein
MQVEEVAPKLPHRKGGLPEEGGFAATLWAEYDDRPPRAFLSPLHHLRQGAVSVRELRLYAGDKLRHFSPHISVDALVIMLCTRHG